MSQLAPPSMAWAMPRAHVGDAQVSRGAACPPRILDRMVLGDASVAFAAPHAGAANVGLESAYWRIAERFGHAAEWRQLEVIVASLLWLLPPLAVQFITARRRVHWERVSRLMQSVSGDGLRGRGLWIVEVDVQSRGKPTG